MLPLALCSPGAHVRQNADSFGDVGLNLADHRRLAFLEQRAKLLEGLVHFLLRPLARVVDVASQPVSVQLHLLDLLDSASQSDKKKTLIFKFFYT